MKKFAAVGFIVSVITVASAQIPEPCMIPTAKQGQAHSLRRSTSDYISPMLSYTAYSLGSSSRFGPSLMFQKTLFQSPQEAIDINGGIMFRFRDSSEPWSSDATSPLGLSPSASPRPRESFLRGMRFGLGFVGLEYTWYLTETDIRPYVGAGGMIMMWPYDGQVAGSVAPTVKAGILANLAAGFSGFAEIKRIIGLPVVVGGESPPLNNLTGFAFGVAFAPRWN